MCSNDIEENPGANRVWSEDTSIDVMAEDIKCIVMSPALQGTAAVTVKYDDEMKHPRKLLLHRGCSLVLHDANPAIPSNRRSSIADDERVQVATCIQGLLLHGCTFILVAVPEDALDAVLHQLTHAAKQLLARK